MSRRSKKCAEAAAAAAAVTVVMLGSEASRGSGGSDTPLHLYENGFTGRLRRTTFAFFTEGRAKCKTHVVQAADGFQGWNPVLLLLSR